MAAGISPLRIAVAGAGAFGRNHLRVYCELQQAGLPIELVAVIDQDAAVATKAAAEFGVPGFGFGSVEACLSTVAVDAASVCVPTSSSPHPKIRARAFGSSLQR